MALYSHEAMRAELDELARGARHVSIVPANIQRVAAAMRQELVHGGGSFHSDPTQYPNESPAANDRDTLQFLFVLTAQEFCIWRRNIARAARAKYRRRTRQREDRH